MDKVAITIGKFDGFHKGHMLLINRLAELKKKGYHTIVCLIDAGRPRILSLDQQKEAALSSGIDKVRIMKFTPQFSSLSPEEFVRTYLLDELHASYVVIGNDFSFGCNRSGNVSTLKELGSKYGFAVESFNKLVIDGNIVSSSLIRELLSDGNIKAAEKYLGRKICFTNEVVHGRHLGTGIGFPTLNIYPEERHMLPRYGVYKTDVLIDGVRYTGFTNIGVKPTVNGDKAGIETFVLDFNKDIYGSTVSIVLNDFIRPEMKFSNLDELKLQIRKDIEKIRG